MSRIGIMGGTFNPIHVGHIKIADSAYKQYELDEVWFMPNHIPAYKSNIDIVSGTDRLNMVNIAISAYPYFKSSDYELKREGKTYTYETLSLLKQYYPTDDFFFIMGADSLFYFDKWVKPDVIVANAEILVASRNDKGLDALNDKIKQLDDIFGGQHFHIITCDNVECSSSILREYIRNTEPEEGLITEQNAYIKKYLDDDVYDYIINQNLYKNH
ncbi:MAG: nicotinate (nicotinamide) nucleotide adenylyltransferase [Lachnospiraceae bacterium]|jgi:nicotinate-nucleotide adenylyltransferase|nr:nicotinate (nicotinamide) nucleotide adenylyltransferase [Lachnospiraceae bacterium]